MPTTEHSTSDEVVPAPPVPAAFYDTLRGWGYTDGELEHAQQVAPPRWCTPAPDPRRDGPVVFDSDEVARRLKALGTLRHTKTRRWQGQPFRPTAWQVLWVIAPVFGWRYRTDHPDSELAGTRVARNAYIEVPRKNGKSTLAAALMLLLLGADREAAPEVYTAATDRDQAKIVFGEAKAMAEASPVWRKRCEPLATEMRYPRNGGLMRALSRVAEAAHGLNVSGAVVDELWAHKTRDLYDAIDSGTGAREQPLVITITTADEGDEFSIYAEQHGATQRLAEGAYRDVSHYGVIWAAAEGDDHYSDAVLARCNPGAGDTVTWQYLRGKRDKALQEPSYANTYLRLHLNVRRREQSRLLPMDSWRAQPCVQPVQLEGRSVYAALDLSTTSDFTALGLLAGPDEHGMFDFACRLWVPEERVRALERQLRVPLGRWVRNGYVDTTEGPTVDYRQVRSEALGWADRLGVRVLRCGYDPWNADETVYELLESGWNMTELRQSYKDLSPATAMLERRTLEHSIRHGDVPPVTWMAGCLEAQQDRSGNRKPAKPEADRAQQRIDAMATLIMGLALWLRYGQKRHEGRRTMRPRSVS